MKSEPGSTNAIREEMVQAADLVKLIHHVEGSPDWARTDKTLDQISRCVRVLAGKNLDELNEHLFCLILAMAGTLLTRCDLMINEKIKRHDMNGTGYPNLPPELIENGWIQRFERLSKFVAEMASVRARLNHLDKLSDQTDEQARTRPRKPPFVKAVAKSNAKDGVGQVAPPQGRRRVRTA